MGEQARMVLPAHGPWLPDHAPTLIRRDMLTSEQMWCMHRWQEHAVLARLPHLLVRTPTLHERAAYKPWSHALAVVHALVAGACGACLTAPSSVLAPAPKAHR